MKTRIISALVMLAIVIPISIVGGISFTIATLIIGLLALKEMIDIKIKNNYCLMLIHLLLLLFHNRDLP